MNAMLLAAGLGTRFQPTTLKIPKPAIPFLNVPLLGYTLYYLEQTGLTNLVVNTHHLPKAVESVMSCLSHGQKYKTSFTFEEKILGSGGGIQNAKKALGAANDFLVCNADEVILFEHDRGFAPLIEFHKNKKALATLLTTNHPDAGQTMGGIWAEDSGKIKVLGGKGYAKGAQHFTGVFVFSPRIFDFMPKGEFHIFTDCLRKAMAAGELVQSYHDASLKWFDMSSERAYILSTGEALKLLNQTSPAAKNLKNILERFGQKMEQVAPNQWLAQNAKFSGTLSDGAKLFLGEGAEICSDAEVKGFAVLGAGAKFAQGVLENTVLAPGIHVNPVTSARNEIIAI